MATPSWTDDHARLVAESAPPVPTAEDAEVDRVWQLVTEAVAAPVRRRRRRRVALGAGAAAIVLGTSGVAGMAAAGLLGSRTGDYNTDPESVRLGGPGELIDPRGADYEQVLVEEIADIPFPSQRAHDVAVADQLEFARRDAESMEQAEARGETDETIRHITGGMRAEAARAAVCSWANSWAAATAAGDAEGRATATEMLQAAPSWPAVTDIDAEQAFSWEKQWVTDESGVTRKETYRDYTPFAWLPLVAKAADGTDPEAVGRPMLEYTRCIPELVPDLPSAVPAELRTP
jgi:hypothetical protein